MILYDFRCTKCDFTFEALVASNYSIVCPECFGQPERQFPAPKVHFNSFKPYAARTGPSDEPGPGDVSFKHLARD